MWNTLAVNSGKLPLMFLMCARSTTHYLLSRGSTLLPYREEFSYKVVGSCERTQCPLYKVIIHLQPTKELLDHMLKLLRLVECRSGIRCWEKCCGDWLWSGIIRNERGPACDAESLMFLEDFMVVDFRPGQLHCDWCSNVNWPPPNRVTSLIMDCLITPSQIGRFQRLCLICYQITASSCDGT